MTCNCNNTVCRCQPSVDNKTKQFPLYQIVDNADMIIGPGNDDYGRNSFGTSSTYIVDAYHPKVAIDVKVESDFIAITYIKRAIFAYTTINNNFTIGGPQQKVHYSDIVFKEIYGVKDGNLELLKVINGRIVPPKLEETYEFPE